MQTTQNPTESPVNPLLNEDYPLTEQQIETYRQDGFIQLNEVITGTALHQLREAVEEAVRQESAPPDPERRPKSPYEQLFIQRVNLWRRHEKVRPFVLCRRFANIAARLMGSPARIWHDQALFKEPREGVRTPWHQDAHYWPHRTKTRQTTIWIALRDATIHNGCMSFIPGTQTLQTLEPINLIDPKDIFDLAPQFKGIKPRTCELKAGSCTFHNGLTFHYAGPNRSGQMREAMAIIYMPDGTRFNKSHQHIVTVPLDLVDDQRLEGEMFPRISDAPV
jgi:ectoine hydroxylase-related dioxygenase (phytanoyl-CoA dioxygenase family)